MAKSGDGELSAKSKIKGRSRRLDSNENGFAKKKYGIPVILLVAMPVAGAIALLLCVVAGMGVYWLASPKKIDAAAGDEKDKKEKVADQNQGPNPKAEDRTVKVDDEPWQTSLETMKAYRGFKTPEASPKPSTYLFVHSSPGEQIVQGKTYFYPDLTKQNVTARDGGFFVIQIRIDGWMLDIGGSPDNSIKLTVQEYKSAKGMWTASGQPADRNVPFLSFQGRGRAGREIGSFRVWELETQGNEVISFAADFIQFLDVPRPKENDRRLFGVLRYHSKFR